MIQERLTEKLSVDDLLSYDEIIIVSEGNNRCRNEAHFSPQGYKRFVDYYHMGEFYKRYTDFQKFNENVKFYTFLDTLNFCIKYSSDDESVKLIGVKNLQ